MTEEIIRKLTGIASHTPLKEADVQHLFALARKLIERAIAADRANYTLLNFYCDWTLHAKIDRSEEGAFILARIHDIILANLKKPNNSRMSEDLTAALSLDKAREQLNILISKYGGNANVFSEEKWDEIIPILAEITSRCPLKIGSHSRLSSILQAIKSHPLKGSSVVEELSIVTLPRATFIPSVSKEEMIYCLLIKTTDTTQFIVALSRT